MANPSISMPDETKDKLDRILTVKKMLGELESDKRSPVVTQLIENYIEENQEYLERYDKFVGNASSQPVAVAAGR